METNFQNNPNNNDWLKRHKTLLFTVTAVFVLAGIVFQLQIRSYWKNYKIEAPTHQAEQQNNQTETPQRTLDNLGTSLDVEPETIPKGASAKCADGTVGYSPNKDLICSDHGGVVKWY